MNKIFVGDVLSGLSEIPDGCVQTCVTSPPYYGLRDYGVDGQIGLEETPDAFISRLVDVFREVRRVLSDDGTLWVNIGDSYNAYNGNRGRSTSFQQATDEALPNLPKGNGLSVKSIKNKDLIGIPWMLAFALRADGWYLRQDIVWHKPNPMPESVRDRCTKAHEYIFLLSKSPKYYFDSEAMQEKAIGGTPGNTKPTKGGRVYQDGSVEHRYADNLHNIGARETRNRRSGWTVATRPFKGAHFAVFPQALIEPCILAGSRHGDLVLDPFMGSGTTAVVATKFGRKYIGCELNPDYAKMAEDRIVGTQIDLGLGEK